MFFLCNSSEPLKPNFQCPRTPSDGWWRCWMPQTKGVPSIMERFFLKIVPELFHRNHSLKHAKTMCEHSLAKPFHKSIRDVWKKHSKHGGRSSLQNGQRFKNYTRVDPKRLFHIHCNVCVHVCGYTITWWWPFFTHVNWQQHESQAIVSHATRFLVFSAAEEQKEDRVGDKSKWKTRKW